VECQLVKCDAAGTRPTTGALLLPVHGFGTLPVELRQPDIELVAAKTHLF